MEHLCNFILARSSAGVHEIDWHYFAIEESITNIGNLVNGKYTIASTSRDKSNIELGEEGLIQLLKKNANLPAGDLMGKICSEVESFAEGTSHMDDMTLVIIKRAS